MELLVRNSVRSVLDIRIRPVFNRPKFVHVDISKYFYTNNINYFEYAFHARSGSFSKRDVTRRIHAGRSSGLSICVYDAETEEYGGLDQARDTLRRSRLFKAELASRALA